MGTFRFYWNSTRCIRVSKVGIYMTDMTNMQNMDPALFCLYEMTFTYFWSYFLNFSVTFCIFHVIFSVILVFCIFSLVYSNSLEFPKPAGPCPETLLAGYKPKLAYNAYFIIYYEYFSAYSLYVFTYFAYFACILTQVFHQLMRLLALTRDCRQMYWYPPPPPPSHGPPKCN